MADNTVADGIIDSLAFAVEALPQENVLELSNTSKATPLNLKIRVRKKDKALFEQGIVSVPKLGQPKKPPERIRIVSSDQTVLSFKVFVDTQPDKKPAKKHKRFFRGCLSSEDYDDDPYENSSFATVSKGSIIAKQNFGLSKTENLTEMQLQPKQPVKFLGNRCKPGGCLDPPIDEDKYAYEPTDTFRHLFTQAHIKKQKQDFITNETFMKKVTAEGILKEAVLPEEAENDKYEIVPDTKSVHSIYQADFIKSTLVARYSGSIITYSHDEIPDEVCDKLISPKRNGDKTRKSFPEFQDNYFIPPKSDTKNRNNTDADRIMSKIGTSFIDRYTSDNVGIFSEVEPIENTVPNLKSICDPKHEVDAQIISSIDIKETQTKTSTLKEDNSNLSIDANRLQSEKDIQQLKEGNVSMTVLKTGTAVTTPLLIAMTQKMKSDKDNNGVESERDYDNNFIETEMNTSIHAINSEKEGIFEFLDKKYSDILTSNETKEPQSTFESSRNDSYQEIKEKKTSKDKNAIQRERVDTMKDLSVSNKNEFAITMQENNKTFESTNLQNKITNDVNKLPKKDIQSANEISKKTEEDDTSHDVFNRQVYTTQDEVTDTVRIDQHLENHSSSEEYLNKIKANNIFRVSYMEENKDIISEINLDSKTILIGLQEVSKTIDHVEANKEESSVASSHIEEDKDVGVSNNMEANKDKVSLINMFQPDQSDRKSGKSEFIKEQHDPLKKQQKNIEQVQATKEEKILFDTNTLVDHENLNRDQRKGTLIENLSDKANIHDIMTDIQYSYKVQRPIAVDIDSQNKDTNGNINKYEDDDLSDFTFNRTQNNDPLDNDVHYNNNNQKNQHYTTHQEFNKYQDADLNYNCFDRIEIKYPLSNMPSHNSDKNKHHGTKNDEIDQDSNKYPDVDLGDNKFAHNNDPLANIENYDNGKNSQLGIKNYVSGQDSNKYQDISLSDNKFDRSQNNVPSDKNEQFNEDKNNQSSQKTYKKNHGSKNFQNADLSDNIFNPAQNNYLPEKNDERVMKPMLKFKDYQETTATGGNESDKTDDSMPDNVLQKQNVQRGNTLKQTYHQVTTLHSDKDRNSEVEKLKLNYKELNDVIEDKAIGKYDEHYGQPSLADNFVNMDIAFHSYINDKNETVIETLNTSKDIKRRPQDNVTIIKTQTSLNAPHVIKIPIDNYRKVIVEVKASDYLKSSSYRTAGPDISGSDNEEKISTVPLQPSETSVSEIESAQNLLSTVYEQLLPLQSLISDLRKDVDILTTQQMLLKENLKKSKRSKPIRLTHSSRKCICTSTYRRSNIRK